MFDLTRQERTILLFLISTLITGLGITIFKKTQQKVCLSVQSGQVESYAELAAHERCFININSLETDDLVDLPGVGKGLAGRIVRYHQENGPFINKEDIMRVKGIGAKKFEAIKDLIAVE